MMGYLIDQGADIDSNVEDETPPLLAAVVFGDLNAVRLLLERGATVSATKYPTRFVTSAAVKGDAATCWSTVQTLKNANGKASLRCTWLWCLTMLMSCGLLLVVVVKMTALHIAVKAGKRDLAKELLHLGASLEAVDHKNDTPFVTATRSAAQNIVKQALLHMLLDHGSDVFRVDGNGMYPVLLESGAEGVQAILSSPQSVNLPVVL